MFVHSSGGCGPPFLLAANGGNSSGYSGHMTNDHGLNRGDDDCYLIISDIFVVLYGIFQPCWRWNSRHFGIDIIILLWQSDETKSRNPRKSNLKASKQQFYCVASTSHGLNLLLASTEMDWVSLRLEADHQPFRWGEDLGITFIGLCSASLQVGAPEFAPEWIVNGLTQPCSATDFGDGDLRGSEMILNHEP